MQKSFSQHCENNQSAIYQVIQYYFKNATQVLEIGSGNGQHAVYFAQKLPALQWQPSDKIENHQAINLWIDDYPGSNISRPLNLDVTQTWPEKQYSGVFSANTCHIMSWETNQGFFAGVAKVLQAQCYFCLYGPFNDNNQYTSESNRNFDCWLKSRNVQMGIRNLQDLQALAEKNHLQFIQRHSMPANNFMLVWQKKE